LLRLIARSKAIHDAARLALLQIESRIAVEAGARKRREDIGGDELGRWMRGKFVFGRRFISCDGQGQG